MKKEIKILQVMKEYKCSWEEASKMVNEEKELNAFFS